MDTFIQQMGRAGRDGKLSQELILYKSHKNQIQNLDHEMMKLIITDSDCRREIIAECYLTKRNLETVIDHICETKCNDIECPRIHAAFSTMDFSGTQEQIRTRNVSVEEEFRTLDKLKLLKESQEKKSSSFITDFEGISLSAIENIINNASTLFTVDDILYYVWSFNMARYVHEIIGDIFPNTGKDQILRS